MTTSSHCAFEEAETVRWNGRAPDGVEEEREGEEEGGGDGGGRGRRRWRKVEEMGTGLTKGYVSGKQFECDKEFVGDKKGKEREGSSFQIRCVS